MTAYPAAQHGAPADFRGDRQVEGEDEVGIELGPILRDVFSTIRRNIWLILTVLALCIISSIVYTLLQVPRYTATTTIEISSASEQILGDEFGVVENEEQSWDVDRYLTTQIDILTSNSMARRVARRLGLYDDNDYFVAMQMRAPAEYPSETVRRLEVERNLLANLDVELPGDSRVVELKFTSTSAEMSADISNAFASEFIESSLQRRFDRFSYARDFVAEQLAEARNRLEISERELNAYAREEGLIRTRNVAADGDNSQNSITNESLIQFNQAANEARVALVDARARWRAESAQPLSSSPAAQASPVVQRLRLRLEELDTELDAAEARYLPDHPTIRDLRSEMAQVEQSLQSAAADARNAVRMEYQAAQEAERTLNAQVARLQGDTIDEQSRSVRYNTLAREADTNRSIYDGLLQRFSELNASTGITASNIAIVDEATPPRSQSSPNPLLNTAIGGIIGLALASMLTFLRVQLDDRIRVPEEVEQKTGLGLLGVIPIAHNSTVEDALQDSFSEVSEAYEALRAALLYSSDRGLPQALLVTSSRPAEGKSTTSSAIARAMAQIDKRTLLIDADMRRPTVHKKWNTPNERGLSDVLVGNINTSAAIQRVEGEKFHVLSAGPLPPSPTRLLASERFVQVLQELRGQYDFIVIDSPPVLGLADTPTLSAHADGVMFVVESGEGRAGALKNALKRLAIARSHVIGAVLTKFDPSEPGNDYSYYGYEYYRYNSED